MKRKLTLPTDTRLRKVTIIRRDDGLWDAIRERDGSGETCTGMVDLDEVFEYVRILYDKEGQKKEE